MSQGRPTNTDANGNAPPRHRNGTTTNYGTNYDGPPYPQPPPFPPSPTRGHNGTHRGRGHPRHNIHPDSNSHPYILSTLSPYNNSLEPENPAIQASRFNLFSPQPPTATSTTSKPEYEICSPTPTSILPLNKPPILLDPFAVVPLEEEEEEDAAVSPTPLLFTEHSHHHNTRDIEIHVPTGAKPHGITVKMSLPMPYGSLKVWKSPMTKDVRKKNSVRTSNNSSNDSDQVLPAPLDSDSADRVNLVFRCKSRTFREFCEYIYNRKLRYRLLCH